MSFLTIMLIVGFLMIFTGCWCLIRTLHMLKLIIGIEIAMKAVTLFLVLAGAVNGRMGTAQAFIVTVIVIEVVVAIIGTGTAVGLYKKYGSMDIRNLRRLKG